MLTGRAPLVSRWWRGQMQDDVGQTCDTPQACGLIKIGKDRAGAEIAPEDTLRRVADERENAVVAQQARQDAARDVTATDDQEFLHCAILPDSDISGEAMSFQVSIQPSRHSFQAEPDETILEAALRQGLSLPYGCRDGVCGSCRGKVLTGEFEHGKAQLEVLSDADRRAGFALFCCAQARSDLCIESREARSLADIPVRTLPARVHKLTRAAPDVMILELKLPANERLRFLAGQYVDILLKEGRRRAFSLANAPHDDAVLQLHVRHVPGGQFTGHVFNTMKERDIGRLRRPQGSFFQREDSTKPMLLVAGGTGFAPIKAIVEHAIAEESQRPMHVYWGGRGRADLYLLELAQQWPLLHANIRFTPVLSDLPTEAQWDGRTGLVHHVALADHTDLSDYQAYVCGSPAMVAAARQDFLARCDLPADEFFADSFDFAADTLAAIDAPTHLNTRLDPHE